MGTFDPQWSATGSDAQVIGSRTGEGPGPAVIAASTVRGTTLISSDGGEVGKISAIMLDVHTGWIAYAVLSEGGFLGMGTQLHAIPWNALTLDTNAECFHVSIAVQQIKDDPGFQGPLAVYGGYLVGYRCAPVLQPRPLLVGSEERSELWARRFLMRNARRCQRQQAEQ
jgi:sporulation protein YlmC with PRC-barrel domain